ncbi:delta(24)-sterol reductase [Anabrus simplex]|uniref:delta(24)-sterol reductase n=1 Tax=Anabrus simplex TaxID=316456 RepID=UPI0035A2B2B2
MLTSGGWDKALQHIIINYRWVFACFFLLPLSFAYEVYSYARNWIVFKTNSAPKQHEKKVKYVQKQVREWKTSGAKVPMCTSRPGYQTMSLRKPKYKNTLYNIHVNLVDILEIDEEKQTVVCEPLVSMGQLTATLVPLGWTIPIVPELDDLTVGGLVMGTGVESSSHIYGLFQHICVSFELVLPDGSLVKCSKDENSELFYGIPWSYGTLGLLTAAEIKIIPAEPYVKLEYKPAYSLDEAVEMFTEESTKKNPHLFVEGLMFNQDQGVIMTGDLVSSYESDKLNQIGKWYKPWFFLHVQEYLQTGSGVEYIPLRDYYHRHSRSLFWEIQDIIPFGNNVLFRYLFGWMMPPKVSLLKLTETKAITELYEKHHFIQDLLVPVSALKESILKFHKEVQIYPLWLCPFNLPNDPGMVHPAATREEMYVDVGVYGVPKTDSFECEKTTRAVEDFVAKVKGFQMLYADSFRSREEFRNMFDHTLYDKLRNKYDCKEAFPDVYDKASKSARI